MNEDKEKSTTAVEEPATRTTRISRKKCRVALLHSDSYTEILHRAMEYIHQDRDVLLAALLDYCGFLHQTPKFFTVVKPKRATRQYMERFHLGYYLDVLEPPPDGTKCVVSEKLLDSMGLVDDCALPTCRKARCALWDYCQYVVGASLQAADLLLGDKADVAIHWGGGRHHAHADQASGFCFVNDVVLAIQHLQKQYKKVLYLDIDIHHGDQIQHAFYDTNRVMTVSFHRHSPGFFPSSSGSSREKGQGDGIGYNLNIPLPKSTRDSDFCRLFRHVVENLLEEYDPEAVVLCVGADGLKGDPLVGETDGWNLTPEGLSECVRFTSMLCSGQSGSEETVLAEINGDLENQQENENKESANKERLRKQRKLLVLGGGGYDPAQTARTFVLSTAAACEGARPGMLSKELPCDVPHHEHFPRYGPEFVLFSRNWRLTESSLITNYHGSDEYESLLTEARKEVDLTILYLQGQRKKEAAVPAFLFLNDDNTDFPVLGKSKLPHKRRRKKKSPHLASANGVDESQS